MATKNGRLAISIIVSTQLADEGGQMVVCYAVAVPQLQTSRLFPDPQRAYAYALGYARGLNEIRGVSGSLNPQISLDFCPMNIHSGNRDYRLGYRSALKDLENSPYQGDLF